MKTGIEYRRLQAEDFDLSPSFFANDVDGNARMFRHDNCGMLHVQGERPNYYFRNMNLDSYRWGGMIRPGNTPLEVQTSGTDEEVAQAIMAAPYGLINDSPMTFAMSSGEPYKTEFTYFDGGCHIVESDILDITCEYFPYNVVMHLDSPYKTPFVNVTAVGKGTYCGKPVSFMGCLDRLYAPRSRENEIIGNATTYICSFLSGIRPDGRKEFCMAQLFGEENGKGAAIYWLEGQEPIITDEVWLEGDWYRLPYVDDGTCVCPVETWRFGGIEVHQIGQWGAKGFTAKPRIERHGQSQVFGTWYAGKTEYKHEVWNSFNENMEVYEERIRNMGFKVIR